MGREAFWCFHSSGKVWKPLTPRLAETKVVACLLLIPSSTWELLIRVLRNQPRGTEENSPLLGYDVGREYVWKAS